jgi:hypothetical protein
MARSRDAADLSMLRAEPHPGQGLGEDGKPVVSHLSPAQGREDEWVAFPGDHRLDHRAGALVPGQRGHHGGQLAQGVLEQLLQPLPVPGPVRRQVGDVPGQQPQRPDLRRRHEAGRSNPISVRRAIHRASSLSVFGRPGRFRACDELTSCTFSPASSSTTNQMRPVVARGFERDRRRAVRTPARPAGRRFLPRSCSDRVP